MSGICTQRVPRSQFDFKCGQWSSEFQSSILKLQSELSNKVFRSCDTELDGLETKLITHLEGVVQKLHDNLLNQADEFFKKCGEHVDIITQWRKLTRQNLFYLCEKHRDQTDDYCRSLIRNRRSRAALDKLHSDIYRKAQEQVRKLALQLRGRKLEKEELERKFSNLWDQLIAQESTARFQKVDMKLESSVENVLKALFCQTQANQLSQKLSESGLRNRGKPLALRVEPKHHLTKGWWQGIKGFYGDSWQVEADKQTAVFCRDAEKHLEDICRVVMYYSEHLSFQVLRKVVEDVDMYNRENGAFNFTQEYTIDLSLTVAALVVRKFEEMIQENATSTIFEAMRKPFYFLFESQYSQLGIETAAAERLSSYLKGPIRTAIIDSLVPDVAYMVKLNDARFQTKHGLLYNILLDLEKKNSFTDYVLYLKNVEESLRMWIKVYTLEYCCTGGQSNLERLANAQLDYKVSLIKDSAKAATLSPPKTLKRWLIKFHEPLKHSFQLNLEEICKVMKVVEIDSEEDTQSFEFFNTELIEHLQHVEEEIRGTLKSLPEQMKDWKHCPYDVLADEMIGCCEQCPFCGTKCEYMDPDHPGDHRASIHRPVCLGGYQTATQELSLDVCTSAVASNATFSNKDTDYKPHPYKKYREIYKDWYIVPNSSRYDSSFWKYFVAHYTDELAEHFGMKKPRPGSDGYKLLQEWKKLEREKVLETLRASFL